MKDNFDLKGYLVENKMTTNSRGEGRIHLTETANLDMRMFEKEQKLLNEVKIPADPDMNPAMEDEFISDPELDECGDVDFSGDVPPLEEAGYTDDDEEDPLGDVPSLADIIGSDPNAKRAQKAAQKDIDRDEKAAEKDDAAAAAADAPVTDEPDPTDPEAGDAPVDPAQPAAPAEGSLASQIKYNPNTVEMMMNSQELESYLNSFRRPQVAVKVLNRALKAAQDEVNDSIGLNHLYLILENGFYITSRSQRGDVIAKVSADQAWRDKNFGD